jgi:ribonuclease BN (tRNA processing enzyme)
MASVRIRILGCGDAFSSGGRLHTSFLLEGGQEPLLIDCGATALVALKSARIAPETIGYVALSHLHGDHFGGLPWMIIDGRFAKRTRPLEIAGPPTTRARLTHAFEALYPGGSAAESPFEVRFVELQARTPCEFGPGVVTPFTVVHESGAPSYALRVEYGGRVIAYSGDTEWTDSLLEAARGADLFVCECNHFDKQVPGHLDYRTLTEKRAQLGCKRLLLTHMSDDMLEHLTKVEVEAAADGMVIEL